MKRFLPLLLAALPLGLLACTPSPEGASTPNPQPVAADPQAETAPPERVTFEGISLLNTLPGTIADGQIVEASAPVPDTPPGDETPEHILFEFQPYFPEVFQNYPGLMLPQIAVYPTEQFTEYGFEGEEAALRSLLDSRPGLASQTTLPYLPPLGAQVLHAAETYLEFNGGSGIRYLTAFSLDLSPLTTERVFYTFQGLTDDGRYVSATFPIQTGLLPDTDNLEGAEYDAFAADYENYLAQTRDRINSANPDSFQPSLAQLDELIESLTVE